MTHLTMAQLVARRDGDRSEPQWAAAEQHLADCTTCQHELERLHQRTAHLRALPRLTPPRNLFPAVRATWQQTRHAQRLRRITQFGVAAAASLVLWVVGSHLLAPPPLDAAAAIAEAQTATTVLEIQLQELHPHQRVLDGGTVLVVLELEDRLADVDRALTALTRHTEAEPTGMLVPFRRAAAERERVAEEVRLWREREYLMDALVRVHATQSTLLEF